MRMRFLPLVLVMTALPLMAADMPPGRWWRRPEVARRLDLTADQQTRLDAIFHDVANELIDHKGQVEKATLAIRKELDRPDSDRQSLQRLAARLTEARGRLFERELMMLVDMRAVLNEQQWTQLRMHLDRQREERNMRDGREGRRPGMPQPRRRPM